MEQTRKPTSHIAPFGLRMQDDLRAQLEGAAKLSGRSLNAEIVQRLSDSLSVSSAPSGHVVLVVDMQCDGNVRMSEIQDAVTELQRLLPDIPYHLGVRILDQEDESLLDVDLGDGPKPMSEIRASANAIIEPNRSKQKP